MRKIIAIDGEGYTRNDCHHYTLMVAADASDYLSLIYSPSLASHQCLDWLTALPANTLLVGYSLDYDTTMILRGLPKRFLEFLRDRGYVYWQYFSIHYVPHRWLTVRNRRTRSVRTIYDVFGFFQSSFVQALRAWHVGTADQIAQIEQMKAQRHHFVQERESEIREYCIRECRLLAQLVQRLIEACEASQLLPRQWYGAGALASALLQHLQADKYLAPIPQALQEPVLTAYYGGRVDTSITGPIRNVYDYDIHSAYPSQMLTLPCLAHGEWKRTREYVPGHTGLYHVRWHDCRMAFPPFPARCRDRILYAPAGSGWYWHPEVEAARQIIPERVTIDDGYYLVPHCTHRPLAAIAHYYALRAQWKAEKHAGERILKLALNALYGKLAQTAGAERRQRAPRFHSWVWAGLITSGCRAQVWTASQYRPDAIISIATDGLMSREPLPVPQGDGLGEWEARELDYVWIYQSGVYEYQYQGEIGYKNRGFSTREIDWQAIKAKWLQNPYSMYQYHSVRFIPFTLALQRKAYLYQIGQWIAGPRRIQFHLVAKEPRTYSTAIPIVWRPMVYRLDATPYRPSALWPEEWTDASCLDYLDSICE